MSVIAFDIGIKNLAWCFLKDKQILGWDNYNLMSESSNLDSTKKASCSKCKGKAVYGNVCSRHCPPTHPPLRDASGNILKKIPDMKTLREILNKVTQIHKCPAKKDELVIELSKFYSIPTQEPKVIKAPDVGLTTLHNSLQKLVKTETHLWSSASIILLENQPAFKNPTMKSVQMLLFATLRDLLPNPPPIKLVHASKKAMGEQTGDAGYKDRKLASEARATKFLKDHPQAEWQTKFTSASKKSDLADALCMCVDYSL